jgi:hypothetical protein
MLRIVSAFSAGEPPARSAGLQRGTPRSSGSISRCRRELVDPAGAVDDEGAARAQPGEHRGDRRHELGRVDADHLRPRAGGIRQGAEDVEDGPRGELTSHGGGMAHGRVMGRSEEEAEAELVDRALDPLDRELEIEAERLEDVRRSRRGRHRPVAVLRHSRAGRGGHERRRRRDVERPRPVAAGAGGIDEVLAAGSHGEHVRPHRLGAAGDLVRGLALQAQGYEEAADLRRRRLAAHHLFHHRPRLTAREVLTFEQPGESFLDHRRPARKLRARAGPSGVRTDSG